MQPTGRTCCAGMAADTNSVLDDISGGLEQTPIPCESHGSLQNHLFPAKFRYVTRNIPGLGCPRDLFEDQLCGCDCVQRCHQDFCSCLMRFGPNYHPTTAQLNPDIVASTSLKPVLECNSQCTCDANCSNRLVQNGPRVKLRVSPAGSRGFGLFACEDIPPLAFVCEYAGEVVSTSEARNRLEGRERDMNYLIVLREHCSTGVVLTCVDPEHMGNVGRFANHSCDPNLLMIPVRVDNSVPKLALFARRSISAGDELTFDYSGDSVLERDSVLGTHLNKQECELTLNHHLNGQRKNHENLAPCEQDSSFQQETGTEKLCVHDKLKFERSDQRTECKTKTTECKSNVANSRFMEPRNFKTDNITCTLCDENGSPCSNTASASQVNQRKRKLPENEVVKLDKEVECKPDNTPQVKQPNDGVQTRRNQRALTACLCGTSLCKGYLPFDSLIFNS